MGPWRAFPSKVTINGYIFSIFFCFSEVASSFSIPISKPERRNRMQMSLCPTLKRTWRKMSYIKPLVEIETFLSTIESKTLYLVQSWVFSFLSSVLSTNNYLPNLESSNCLISLESCSSFTHASSLCSNGKLTSSFGIGYPGQKKDEKHNSLGHQRFFQSWGWYLGHMALNIYVLLNYYYVIWNLLRESYFPLRQEQNKAILF